MKIQTPAVLSFIKEIRLHLEGIIDTLKHGDDGFIDSCMQQIEAIYRSMDNFTIDHLTPLTPIEKAGKNAQPYISLAQSIREKMDKDGNYECSSAENIAIVKERLYFFIKRELRSFPTLSDVAIGDLCNFIEGEIIPRNQVIFKQVYSNEFYYASMQVIDHIIEEITDHRANNPQQNLF